MSRRQVPQNARRDLSMAGLKSRSGSCERADLDVGAAGNEEGLTSLILRASAPYATTVDRAFTFLRSPRP
jgi:hypothetical protein